MSEPEDLSYAFALRRQGFELHMAQRLPAGRVTALVGPSGGGKSTALRVLAGLERPQRGWVRHGGRVWLDMDRGVALPPQRRGVGMVFQSYALFPHLSALENAAYALPRQRCGEAAEWLRRLCVDDVAQRYPDQLSGGQRQRVALARALAAEPSVLLLDEPFAAVDTSLRRHLRRLLRASLDVWRCPVLMVTHDLEDVRELADRVGVLVGGHLHVEGETAEVLAAPRTVEAARVLGWSNLLVVDEIAGRSVRGAWGEASLAEPARAPVSHVGIRPEHVSLDVVGCGLPARVRRCRDLGAVWALECELPGGVVLELQRPAGTRLPPVGKSCRLGLPAHRLVGLTSGSRVTMEALAASSRGGRWRTES